MKRIEAFARSDANIDSLGVLDIYYHIYLKALKAKGDVDYFGSDDFWHKFKYTDYWVMLKAHDQEYLNIHRVFYTYLVDIKYDIIRDIEDKLALQKFRDRQKIDYKKACEVPKFDS